MKTDVIEIPIPAGHTASFDEQSGKITFKKKPHNVMERIKSIADVLTDNNLTQQYFDECCEGLDVDEVGYRLAKLIAKSLNEGWFPNWDNSNEGKYYPWFYMAGSSGFRCRGYDGWAANSNVGSRLCFKTHELAKYAATQFTDVYKKLIIN